MSNESTTDVTEERRVPAGAEPTAAPPLQRIPGIDDLVCLDDTCLPASVLDGGHDRASRPDPDTER